MSVVRQWWHARTRAARLTRHLPAVLICTAFAILQTWPLARHSRDTLATWGDPVFQMWTMAWNWHALTTAPLAIFDANIFYPWRNTLAYSDHLFGQTLLIWPVLAFTGNGILADNIALFLAFILSAFAMYLLVYDITGNRAAGILAGLAYALAPSRMAHIEHLHLLTAQWPPLILLCLRRATFERGRRQLWWAAGAGAAFFMQGLFGIYFFYFTIVMLLIAGAVYLGVAAWARDRNIARGLLLSAAACAVAGLLLLPTLLPYQAVHNELGVEREESEVNLYRAEWSDYLAVWPRNRLYNDWFVENHRDIERDLFPGLLISGFALLGLANRRGGRFRWVLLAITLGAIWMSFGLRATIFGVEIPAPYRLFYDYLPGFRAIRVPARLGLLALVGMGGLAGLGIDLAWRYVTGAAILGRFSRRDEPRVHPRPETAHKEDERTPGPVLSNSSRRVGWLPQAAVRPVAYIGLTLGLLVVWAETATIMELPPPLLIGDTPPAYAWMRENPAPTIELPMGDGPVGSAWPNFWSTMHWNQVANGYSGIIVPTYDLLREEAKRFPDPETVRFFQGMGIETVVIHGDFPEAERAAVEAQLAANPDITLELAGPDAVYSLAPDPWLWRLAEAAPDGATVDLPDAGSNPLYYGHLVAILQRTGHTVRGNGEIGWMTLKQAGAPECYVILGGSADPAAFGYASVEALHEEEGFILYHRAGCE